MRTIKLRTSTTSGAQPGDVVELPEGEAHDLVRQNFATYADGDEPTQLPSSDEEGETSQGTEPDEETDPLEGEDAPEDNILS